MRCHRFALCALLLFVSPVALRAQEPEADESLVTEASFSKEEEAADKGDCDCDCTCYDPCCGRHLYISAIAGVSFMNGQSGGFNTLGPHNNTRSANDELFLAGGAIGVAIPREFGTLRVEFEAQGRNNFRGVTASLQPNFFYDVQMSDGWSTMVNAWFDVQVRDNVAVYAGGGIGAAGYNLSVGDGVVAGQGSVSEFAWQVGTGVIYQVHDRIELDFGYRYADLGTGNIGLNFGGVNAGNYTLNPTSHDVLLQLRIHEPLSFLRQ